MATVIASNVRRCFTGATLALDASNDRDGPDGVDRRDLHRLPLGGGVHGPRVVDRHGAPLIVTDAGYDVTKVETADGTTAGIRAQMEDE